jgi:hypothetical protein
VEQGASLVQEKERLKQKQETLEKKEEKRQANKYA